ncbi:MAG: glycoside hydrolase family 44 protein [Xanthomonadales bacterium]|nr:glycoside hydrolase family 44 protein [Xanthomonadales bacterium]
MRNVIANVFLILASTLAASAQAATVAVQLDLQADRHSINPLIFGVSGSPDLSHLAYPLVRWGGNSTTRYNWQADVHNTASDWFFMNIPDGDGSPAGSSVEALISSTLGAGSQPLLTLSTIGWMPKPVQQKRWSFSVAKYGQQLVTECSYFGSPPPDWCAADAGNGRCSPAQNHTGYCDSAGDIVGNDPLDSSDVSTAQTQTGWMAHLQQRFGTAANGGVRYYALDNEPMLWNSTHRDVHPLPLTYDEIWQRTVTYASAIKAQDPAAKILGPVTWGYCDLFGSAADNCLDGSDRAAHGGTPFIQWYLQQVCSYQAAHGVRLVDYLDLHYYPQGAGVVDFSDPPNGSETTDVSARRLRSLKELYDPAWDAESWLSDLGNSAPWHYSRPSLIPRVRAWIDASCPGTGLSISEYNWGADNGASSALAQAEALAIFAREGVDMAARWVAPAAGSLVERAFRLYLDFDGNGARVEGESVRATSANVDALGAFAVHKAGSRVMVLLFNKATTSTTAALSLGTRLTGPWKLYQFSAGSGVSLVGSGSLDGSSINLANLPARSASLLVLPDVDRIFADSFDQP